MIGQDLQPCEVEIITIHAVWGNPRQDGQFVACSRALDPETVTVSLGGQYASFDVGPVPVSGPVIATDPSGGKVVLIDQGIPDWATAQILSGWGWQVTSDLPSPARYPFQVDVLLVSRTWSGSFEGWSTSRWFDTAVRPLQRLPFTTETDNPNSTVTVHVLEAGQDTFGVGYVAIYAPDPTQLVRSELLSHGWRQEPSQRLRSADWQLLAELSEAAETITVPLLRSAIISEVIIHDVERLDIDAVNLLPPDVREVFDHALTRSLDFEGRDGTD